MQDNLFKVMDAVEAQVEEYLTKEGVRPEDRHVVYSAYRSDKNGRYRNNLHTKPVKGKVRFIHEGYDGPQYVSHVMDSPTYLELTKVFNDAMHVTRDYHHSFLEGVRVIEEKDDITVAKFIAGS